jgi:hypothetical protein
MKMYEVLYGNLKPHISGGYFKDLESAKRKERRLIAQGFKTWIIETVPFLTKET